MSLGRRDVAPFPRSDHCDGRRFFNPRQHINRTWRDIWQWKRTSRAAPWPRWIEIAPASALPAPTDGTLRATWINHATVLLRSRVGTMLTDPVFSSHAGPFGRLGPRRVHAPGIRWADLPNIDVVLLSHDHYDHCDLPTLRRLSRRFPACRLVCPLGCSDLARRAGFAPSGVIELDWWEAHELAPGWHVRATPSRHWSNRLSGPRNGRLWCGFYLQAAGRTALYTGDTAYDDQMFAQIAERCSPPDLAIIPIGAYEPRWFMAAQHCDPAEAVHIHQDLQAGTSLAVHWGTFQLTDEARNAPPAALAEALRSRSVAPSSFRLLTPGQSLTV